MKIGVLGTGMVGQTIASKLAELGHDVRMGSRTAANDKATAWAAEAGARASSGTFADSARFGDLRCPTAAQRADYSEIASPSRGDARDARLGKI